MTSPVLLDTCAAIWLAEAEAVAQDAERVLEAAYDAGAPVFVSPISAWEIGMLASRGRVALLIKPQLWFQRLFEVLNFSLADMSPQVLIASSFLPGVPPRDPAD